MPLAAALGVTVARVSAPSALPDEGVPLLVVTDVAARLVRRGLLAPADAAADRWRQARVFVFRRGPVVSEPAPGAWPLAEVADPLAMRAR
ncbi:MAG TPA: hypothetical protein VK531_02315 [Gemmatimonadales bacterium]|nr:hypothetical protein [Gemmatimonadales bacterium]